MDAAIAAVLRQAAAAIGEPDRAAQVERVACEARAGDLAYLSGDDSDDSDDDAWEYAACPDAEQRFEAVESALAYRYASSRSEDADVDAVAFVSSPAPRASSESTSREFPITTYTSLIHTSSSCPSNEATKTRSSSSLNMCVASTASYAS